MSLPQPEKPIDEVPKRSPGPEASAETASTSYSQAESEAPTLVPPQPNVAEAETVTPAPQSTGLPTLQPFEAPRVDLAAGILGPYREVRRLRAWKAGAIYSGTVYSAVHTRLRRHVELLVLDGGVAHESSTNAANELMIACRDAFLQTARKAAAIRHPNVETGLLEAARYGDVTLVARERSVLEPVDGFGPRDRSQRLREPLYPNGALARALLEGARGLAAIHRAGLRHGHITRAVLRRGSHGQVCITALREDPAGSNLAPPMSEGIVQEAVQKDLTDLGIAFAEIICGVVPELGGRPETSGEHWRILNPGLSCALAATLDRCLSADSPYCFQDAQELVQELEKLTEFEMVPVSWRDRLGTHLYDAIALAIPAFSFFSFFMAIEPHRYLFEQSGPAGCDCLECCLLIERLVRPLSVFRNVLGWTPGRRIRGFRLLNAAGERPMRSLLLARCLLRFCWLIVFELGFGLGFGALLRLLDQNQSGPQVENLFSTLNLTGLVAAGALLAMTGLYLTSLCTPDGRPLHDYLTGISWYQRRRKEEVSVLKVTESARITLPSDSKPSAQTVAPDAVLGRMGQYELRGLLGEGGMGAVYLAQDTILERVALKMLTSSVGITPSVLHRFEREARLAAQLSHPNVAQVFSFGEVNGQPYIVMEFVDGEDLQQLVRREGALSVDRAWQFIRQTALALREASRHGIVHRDIKPANLLLAGNGVVKVTDFGISRAFGEEAEKTAPAPALARGHGDVGLTKTGALLGTPQYLSPEQARGEKLDIRSDIYSLGMTLYFLVTGKPPFEGVDIFDLVYRQCNEEPASLPGSVKDWTLDRDEVICRMIAKDREARFQNYDDLLEGLDATAPKQPAPAHLGRRFAAELLDQFVLVYIVLQAGLACKTLLQNRETAAALIDVCVSVLYVAVNVIGTGRWGTTPGKWILSVEVIRPGKPRVGYGHALLRVLILYPIKFWSASIAILILTGAWGLERIPLVMQITISFTVLTPIPLLISCYLIQATARRRGVHDLAAGTMVMQLPVQKGRWRRVFKKLRLGR